MRTAAKHPSLYTLLLSILLPSTLLAGCASPGLLGEYDFRDRTVGVTALDLPMPEVRSGGWVDVDESRPLLSALRVGAEVAREVQAHRSRPVLEAAARDADLEGRMMDRLLQGAARELRATPVANASNADFELELRVREYGIDARQWLGPAEFFLRADVTLRDGPGGRRIWRGKVKETRPLSPQIWGAGAIVGDVVTAAALASLDAAEMIRALEALADFAAHEVLHELHRGMEASRPGR